MHVQYVQTNEKYNQCPQVEVKLYKARCWLLSSAGWACSPLKSKTMTWLRCSDRIGFFGCEIFRAGMENKQILDGLCPDNGIIQIENGRRQFSHNHVFCLSISLCLPPPCLSFSLTRSVVCTQTHMPFSLYRSALLLFSLNPDVAMCNGTYIESSLQLR